MLSVSVWISVSKNGLEGVGLDMSRQVFGVTAVVWCTLLWYKTVKRVNMGHPAYIKVFLFSFFSTCQTFTVFMCSMSVTMTVISEVLLYTTEFWSVISHISYIIVTVYSISNKNMTFSIFVIDDFLSIKKIYQRNHITS